MSWAGSIKCEELIGDTGTRKCCDLAHVIGGRHFNHIHADKVDAFNGAQDI